MFTAPSPRRRHVPWPSSSRLPHPRGSRRSTPTGQWWPPPTYLRLTTAEAHDPAAVAGLVRYFLAGPLDMHGEWCLE